MNFQGVDYVIAPFGFHRHLLQTRQGDFSLSYQLLTKEQFLEQTAFQINPNKALEVLILHEKVSPSFASLYLSLLTFIPPFHDDPKIKQLRMYYDVLIKHQAITFPPFIQTKFSNKRVAILGYIHEDRLFNERLHSLSMDGVFDPYPTVQEGLVIDRLETIADEVSLFFNRVLTLHAKGISSEDIVLINPPSTYRYELERQATYFHVPLQLPSNETFFDAPITQAYIQQDNSLDAFLETCGNLYPLEHQAQLKKLVMAIPSSIQTSIHGKDYLRLLAQDVRLHSSTYENPIRVVPLGSFSPSTHVFILGFSQGVMPRIYRDIGWLDDRLKASLGLMTSPQLNEQDQLRVRYGLAHSGHLFISRSKQSPSGKVLPSPFVDTLKMKEQDRLYTEDHVDYSGNLGPIRKRLYEERWTYYRDQHPYLSSLKQVFPADAPRFQYRPTPVDVSIPSPLKLSYSAINDYYQCGFKYFVSRVLKVQPYDPDEFYMHLGTFAHDVFEHMRGDLGQFSLVFDQRLADQQNLTSKEKVLFAHLKSKLEEVAQFNSLHQQKMVNPSFLEELEVLIPINEDTLLKGVIDRTILLSDEQGQEYVALMDYKSGSESFDASLIEYGWSLQLPIYALMIHHHPDLKNRELLGVFIQHILHKSYLKKGITIGNQTFPATYQFDGVMIEDRQKAALLDQTLKYDASPFFLSTKPASDDYLKSNRHVVSSTFLTSMQAIAKTKIEEASANIRHHHFPLNPRKIKQKASCDYCPFQDVCFRQHQDIEVIRINKEETVSDESD